MDASPWLALAALLCAGCLDAAHPPASTSSATERDPSVADAFHPWQAGDWWLYENATTGARENWTVVALPSAASPLYRVALAAWSPNGFARGRTEARFDPATLGIRSGVVNGTSLSADCPLFQVFPAEAHTYECNARFLGQAVRLRMTSRQGDWRDVATPKGARRGVEIRHEVGPAADLNSTSVEAETWIPSVGNRADYWGLQIWDSLGPHLLFRLADWHLAAGTRPS